MLPSLAFSGNEPAEPSGIGKGSFSAGEQHERRRKPATLKPVNHGYVHTFAEMNGWDEKEKHEANWAWLDPENLRATTNDVGIWEAAMEMIKLVPFPNQRRALWAWARPEAGGQAFTKWCKNEEGISRQIGNYRRKRAIEQISSAFDRKPLQDNEFYAYDGFTDNPEKEDKRDLIRGWLAEDAKPAPSFDQDIQDFSWAEAQNARRREREARKRQEAA
ncbi:hypothetical protein ABID21_003974 [Pseudorhizobium tarimense]|uniref:Uncharacterized protein n=1 Tax=Pseudorhizobium tarimense TaxID=1079109 RepID=A0ABV2HBB7_9HYPH|nr:PP2C family serine/threonine-protein phosphatase [Pseudorhizobium tarimense]MCJ8520751.1 protein phosphatase 2C family protein [Pseudorhizobium tarimense]